jgi:WD40 repeat protein
MTLWDVQSAKVIREFKDSRGEGYRGAIFSPNGQRILSRDQETLKLWEVKSGKVLRTFEGHKDSVIACVFSADSPKIYSMSRSGGLSVWNCNSGKQLHSSRGIQGVRTLVRFRRMESVSFRLPWTAPRKSGIAKQGD